MNLLSSKGLDFGFELLSTEIFIVMQNIWELQSECWKNITLTLTPTLAAKELAG